MNAKTILRNGRERFRKNESDGGRWHSGPQSQEAALQQSTHWTLLSRHSIADVSKTMDVHALTTEAHARAGASSDSDHQTPCRTSRLPQRVLSVSVPSAPLQTSCPLNLAYKKWHREAEVVHLTMGVQTRGWGILSPTVNRTPSPTLLRSVGSRHGSFIRSSFSQWLGIFLGLGELWVGNQNLTHHLL